MLNNPGIQNNPANNSAIIRTPDNKATDANWTVTDWGMLPAESPKTPTKEVEKFINEWSIPPEGSKINFIA